jgi:hypothetical protein
MAKKKPRPVAVILTKTIRTVVAFIYKMKLIVIDIGNNAAYFPTPSPTLALLTTNIGKLEAAEALAKTRAPGAVSARDIVYDLLLTNQRNILIYVQQQADLGATELVSINIIQSAGLDVQLNGKHVKPPIAAKSGNNQVKLIAKAVEFAGSYNWDISSDLGKTWTNITTTTQASYTVKGLTTGDILQFRVRAILPAGPNPWSIAVSAVVQ